MSCEDRAVLPALASGGLTLTSASNPFGMDFVTRRLPAGASLEHIVRDAGIDPDYAYVTIDGEVVSREWLPRVRPRAGTVVTARQVPQGGRVGKAIFGIVLGIGLIAFGAFSLIASSASWAAGTVGALGSIASGLGVAATGVSSILSPPPDRSTTVNNTSVSIGAVANNETPYYRPVQRNYGSNLMYPYIVGKPYVHMVGDKPYRVMLLSFGYGPNKVENIRRGDSPFEQLPVRWNVFEGWDDDAQEFEYYRRDVDEIAVGTVLKDGNTSWQENVTENDTKSAHWVFTFEQGLVYFADNRTKWVEVEVDVEWRVAGSADPWTPADVFNDSPNVKQDTLGTVRLRGENTGSVIRAFSVRFPSRGQYETRIRRGTRRAESGSDNDDKFRDDMTLTLFQSSRPAEKPNVPNLTLLELEYNTSNERGQVDRINAVVTSYLPTWNNLDGWGSPDRVSTNPSFKLTRSAAWAFAENLRGPQCPSQIDDSQIDGQQLLDWDVWLASMNRTFRCVVDGSPDGGGGTVYDVAKNIARAGRADFTLIDGAYTITMNAPQALRRQTFSDRNVSNLQVTRNFRKVIQGYTVTFIDPNADYQIAERKVYAQGFDENTADVLTDLDLTFGVDSADVAYSDAKLHEASVALQPRVVSFEVDAEQVAATQGDRVGFRHDVMLVGLSSARIRSLNIVADEIVSFESDVELDYSDATLQYGVVIRASDSAHYSGRVATQSGGTGARSNPTFRQVVFLEPVPINIAGGFTGPVVGDLFNFGEFGKEDKDFEIVEVAPTRHMAARISLVDYDEAIYAADTQPYPSYDPGITTPVRPEIQRPAPPVIGRVLADEEVFRSTGITGVNDAGIGVWYTIQEGDSPSPSFVEINTQLVYGDDGELDEWQFGGTVEAATNFIAALGLEQGKTYNVRVRTITDTGITSTWREALGVLVVGLSTPPPAPTNPRDRGGVLAWDYDNPPADFDGFVIRYQTGTETDWASAVPIGRTVSQFFKYSDRNLPSGTVTLIIRAIDRAGNLSDGQASRAVSIAVTQPSGVVWTHDMRAAADGANSVGPWDYGSDSFFFGGAVDTGDNNYLKGNAKDNATDSWWPDDPTLGTFWPEDPSVGTFWGLNYFDLVFVFQVRTDDVSNHPIPWPGFLELTLDQSWEGSAIAVKYALDNAGLPNFELPAQLPVPADGDPDPKILFLVTVFGGSVQPVLKDMWVRVTRPERTVVVEDFQLLSQGEVVPGLDDFTNITSVSVTVVDDPLNGIPAYTLVAAKNVPSPGSVSISSFGAESGGFRGGMLMDITVTGV